MLNDINVYYNNIIINLNWDHMRISQNQKEILKTIGILGIIAASFVAPNIIQILKPLIKKQPKKRYKPSIKKLIENDIIYLSGERIQLTEKGKQLLAKIEIDDISSIKKDEIWDGNWHLVCYDIPEHKRKERDYLRFKLFEFGFKKIQNSLWTFPYNCKQEIAVISQTLGISPYVAYLTTDHLPTQENLIKYFDLETHVI